MKRWIALVAAALVTPALVTASSASAAAAARTAPADPVKALRQQLRPEHGVQVTEITHGSFGKQKAVVRSNGSLQFGPSGIVAVDLTQRVTLQPPLKDGESASSQRYISLKGKSYISGDLWADRIPEGKTWVRLDSRLAGSGTAQEAINVFDPSTLKFLVRETNRPLPNADGVRYTGVTTWSELYKVSPSVRRQLGGKPTGDLGRSKIKWRLWLDGRGLTSRLVTETATSFGKNGTMRFTTDSRYTGWGSRVVITAPPADQVADLKDVDFGDDVKPETPLNIIVEGAKNN